MNVCSFPDCGGLHESRGLCAGHAKQSRKGRPLTPLVNRDPRQPFPSVNRPGCYLVPLTGGKFALIDAADAKAVGHHGWTFQRKGRGFYAAAAFKQPDGRWAPTSLHLFLWALWGMPPAGRLDHANRDGLDCRRENLRPATAAQNVANADLRSDNTSGRRSVQFHSKTGKYTAKIRVDGKQKFLGTFTSLGEAGAVYDAAARARDGEFFPEELAS